MCVCGTQERGCEYSNVQVHVPARAPAQMCICTESPVFCYGPPLYSLSPGSLRRTQNSLIQLVLASQLALSPPPEPQVTTMPNSHLHRAGVLNTSSHVYNTSVLTPEPPPSLLLRHSFTYHWTIRLRILELVSHPLPACSSSLFHTFLVGRVGPYTIIISPFLKNTSILTVLGNLEKDSRATKPGSGLGHGEWQGTGT